jgi:hypothetical protein
LTYEAAGEAVKVTNEGVNAQGNPTKSVFGPFTNDGKPSPVTRVPDFNESIYKKVNDTTVEFVRLKDGKEVQRGTRVVSTDGKTLTFSTKGVSASGQQIDNVAVTRSNSSPQTGPESEANRWHRLSWRWGRDWP